MLNFYKKNSDREVGRLMPFAVLAVGMVFIHALIRLNYGDDPGYSRVLTDKSLIPWLVTRYEHWSSRSLIDALTAAVLNMNVNLWRFADIAIIVFAAVSVSKLFSSLEPNRNNWVIVGFLFIYPFHDLYGAGWGCTTINYLWPLAFGLYSVGILRKIVNNEEIRWYEYLLSSLALVFAVNLEQLCIIMLFVHGIFFFYLVTKGRINLYLLVQTALCAASLVYIVICPGNAERFGAEIKTWFPAFSSLSLVNNLELGFTTSISKYILQMNRVYFAFSGILCYAALVKLSARKDRILGSLPFVLCLFIGVPLYLGTKISPEISNRLTHLYGNELAADFVFVPNIPLVLIFLGVCLSVFTALYLYFGKTYNLILSLFVLSLGLGSRIIMGFSPTIWGSGPRTFIFMNFSMILCSIMVYRDLAKSHPHRLRFLNFGLGVISAFAFIKIVMTLIGEM